MEIKVAFAKNAAYPSAKDACGALGGKMIKSVTCGHAPEKAKKINELGQKYNMKFVSSHSCGMKTIKL